MKKILIILVLLVTSSFAQQVASQITEKNQELYGSIMSGVCDVSTIEKLIKEGADVNYRPKKRNTPDGAMYVLLLKYKTPSCDKAAELLKSNGAKSYEQLQAEWEAAKPSEQELLNETLIKAVKACELNSVKELIAKGADKNTVADKKDGWTVFMEAAGYGSIRCAEIANYLSSLGADSRGITHLAVKTHKYDKPKVFENKHLNMTIGEVRFDGYSKIRLWNKADEPIYIYSILNETNGYKKLNDHKKNPRIVKNDNLDPTSLDAYSGIGLENRDGYPKIVNNKTSFKRQFTIGYKYKGKMYELKTPVMNEEYEVEYSDDHLGLPDIQDKWEGRR